MQLQDKGEWKEMLDLFAKEKDKFSNVNYATMMSRLSRTRSLLLDDPLYKAFVINLADQMDKRGLQWMGTQGAANIVYSIAKMKPRSTKETRHVAALISTEENARWMIERGRPQEIANMAWSFAKLGIGSTTLFTEIEKRAEWLINHGNPQEVANVAWAFAKRGIRAPTFFAEIDKHAEWLVKEGNTQEVVLVAWAGAKLGISPSLLFKEIEKNSQWLITEGTPQAVATVAWALATLGTNEYPMLFSEIENQAERLVKVEGGNERAIASIAWSFATLGIDAPVFFTEIDKKAEWIVKGGNSQSVSNTAWAFAKLGTTDAPRLFAEIEQQAERLIAQGNTQEVANLAWSFAKRGIDAPGLFSEIEKRTEWLVRDGNAHEVENTAWAFAMLGIEAPFLFTEIEKRGEWILRDGNTQNVTKAEWAFAKLGVKVNGKKNSNRNNNVQKPYDVIDRNKKIVQLGRQGKWKEMLDLFVKDKENFNNVNYSTMMSQLGRIKGVQCDDPLFIAFVACIANQMKTRGLRWMGIRQTANTVHSIAKMKLDSKESQCIMTLVSEKENARLLVKEGEPQAISNVAWAFAKLGISAPALFKEIDNHAESLVTNGKFQAVANTAWAFATLGIEGPCLFAEITKHAQWLAKHGKPQELTNTVWAFAELGVEVPKIFLLGTTKQQKNIGEFLRKKP